MSCMTIAYLLCELCYNSSECRHFGLRAGRVGPAFVTFDLRPTCHPKHHLDWISFYLHLEFIGSLLFGLPREQDLGYTLQPRRLSNKSQQLKRSVRQQHERRLQIRFRFLYQQKGAISNFHV